jgi:hypothetical protein
MRFTGAADGDNARTAEAFLDIEHVIPPSNREFCRQR